MIKTSTLWLLAACALFSGPASAQITVSRSVIEFSPDTKIQDIEITNNGDFKIYLDMTVAEILNPEAEESTRVEMDDPRTAAILVSPRQLLVPPGQRKRVRVILREPALDVDRVFRMAVKPYTGKVQLKDSAGDKKSSAIKVLVGYDLLLLSRPARLRPDVQVTRTDDSIEFSNQGNTNVLLRKIEQCDSADADCVDLPPNRLYVGETYKVALPKKGDAGSFPVKVFQSVALENSRASY